MGHGTWRQVFFVSIAPGAQKVVLGAAIEVKQEPQNSGNGKVSILKLMAMARGNTGLCVQFPFLDEQPQGYESTVVAPLVAFLGNRNRTGPGFHPVFRTRTRIPLLGDVFSPVQHCFNSAFLEVPPFSGSLVDETAEAASVEEGFPPLFGCQQSSFQLLSRVLGPAEAHVVCWVREAQNMESPQKGF